MVRAVFPTPPSPNTTSLYIVILPAILKSVTPPTANLVIRGRDQHMHRTCLRHSNAGVASQTVGFDEALGRYNSFFKSSYRRRRRLGRKRSSLRADLGPITPCCVGRSGVVVLGSGVQQKRFTAWEPANAWTRARDRGQAVEQT